MFSAELRCHMTHWPKSLAVMLALVVLPCACGSTANQAPHPRTDAGSGTVGGDDAGHVPERDAGQDAGRSVAAQGGSGGHAAGGAGHTIDTNAGAGGASLTPVGTSDLPAPDPNARITPNLDSAVIHIQPVAGAKDYRAFIVNHDVQVLTDSQGGELVKGATIFCAGQRQRAAPALPVAEVMTDIEVTGITEKQTFVVEAIDTLCPFTGLFGLTDTEYQADNMEIRQYLPALLGPVPVLSEASMRAMYDSMIINGHAGATKPGRPAPPTTPKVLKRWTVDVAPLAAAQAAKRKTADFFSGFSRTEQPQWVEGGTNNDGSFHAPDGRGYSITAYRDQDFIYYATNAELVGKNQFFYDRGQLQMLLADLAQDTMSSALAIPRKLAHVANDKYLHVTFENSTNSTPRRYWWLSVCGPESAGQTFKPDGLLSEWMVLTAGFFNNDGLNPSVGRWNCLVVFPHDGIGTPVPADSGSNPQSSIIVLIHKAGAADRESAVNVSPQQLNDGYPRAWYRTHKGKEVTTKGVLDDYLQQAPRVQFDMYISRSRLVMYVNGEQRICNDFGPQPLTMAEAAVGFNDALYHTSAEHTELTLDFADRSGQRYYLENTPFADPHTYDNVGFEEGVALPESFSANDCYVHAP